MKWFEIGVKYYKNIDGNNKKVSENYLIDAISFSESESRTLKKLESSLNGGELRIEEIVKSNIIEIFDNGQGSLFCKVGVDMMTLDEAAGIEKKKRFYYLVRADNLIQGLEKLESNLYNSVVPYVFESIKISTILEVFNYSAKDIAEELMDKIGLLTYKKK